MERKVLTINWGQIEFFNLREGNKRVQIYSMRIKVNDVKLYFDIDGVGCEIAGSEMAERPTLVLIHGGPGIDHSYFKPAFSEAATVAQVLYYDHRGHGRSDRSNKNRWNLDQWADDAVALLETLGIRKPVLFGQSFGGIVAQNIAIRYPNVPGKLVLSSTMGQLRIDRIVTAFEIFYGHKASAAAQDFWNNLSDPTANASYVRYGYPRYNTTPQDQDQSSRTIKNTEVLLHFYGQGGEGHRFNYLPELHKVRVPTLILAGEKDPISTVSDARDLAQALPSHLVKLETFSRCGHGVHRDNPKRAFAILKAFMTLSP